MRFVFPSLLIAFAVGCGTSEPPVAAVSGQVLLNDKSVPAGAVSFVSADGRTATAPIVDGKYTMERAPIGSVKVGITTPSAAGNKQMFKQKVEGKSFDGSSASGVEVPGRYANPDSSGITLDVPAAGSSSLDIKLKK